MVPATNDESVQEKSSIETSSSNWFVILSVIRPQMRPWFYTEIVLMAFEALAVIMVMAVKNIMDKKVIGFIVIVFCFCFLFGSLNCMNINGLPKIIKVNR